MAQSQRQYQLLIYQVPSQPSAARVSVWRELKRMGALYLQQSVCIFPTRPELKAPLHNVAQRVTALGGSYHLLPLRALPHEEEAKIVEGFLAQSNQQYDEIIEYCEVNFTKEIEFEHYRQNYTYAEAEEIRQDLDKIRHWFDRVVERDWCGASKREDTAAGIERCEKLLEEFELRVFAEHQAAELNPALAPTSPPIAPIRLHRRAKPRGPRL